MFPLLGLAGMAGVALILIEVVWTHEIGRIAGPAWVLLCLAGYLAYRYKRGMPLLGSAPRNWEEDQMRVLEEAGEFDLLEQYRNSLASERRWQQRGSRRR